MAKIPLTDEEKQFIIENIADKSAHYIGLKLQRATLTINKFLAENNIEDKKRVIHKKFTDYDRGFILDNYTKMQPRKIAEHLGRTAATIYDYMYTHGLTPYRKINSIPGKSRDFSKKQAKEGIFDVEAIGAVYF